MPTESSKSDGSIYRTAIPCNCGCSCVMLVDISEWHDEPREMYVEFSLGFHASFMHRLRAAWRVMRGKDPWLHSVAWMQDDLDKLKKAL